MLCVAAFLIAGGCGQSEKAERLRSDLDVSQAALQTLNAENERLQKQQHKLQSRIMELQTDYDDLLAREARLAQWARRLVERFGPGLWYFGPDDRPLPMQPLPEATPFELITALNRLFAADHLPEATLVRVEGEVAYVRVDADEQLTQTMGSAGATGYIQAVTYTLCSLPDIDSVDFDFHEGDHAVPGRYFR